jgi:hypothetical protein
LRESVSNISDRLSQITIIWINDVSTLTWRLRTLIVMMIKRWTQNLKWWKNEKEKQKKTRSFYVFKIKITSLFISFYELRYLLISDIIRLIFKWQQSTIKQKVLIKTTIRRIRFSIFITHLFTQKKSFRTTNKVLRIRYSIMSFEIIKYFHFRSLFSRSY